MLYTKLRILAHTHAPNKHSQVKTDLILHDCTILKKTSQLTNSLTFCGSQRHHGMQTRSMIVLTKQQARLPLTTLPLCRISVSIATHRMGRKKQAVLFSDWQP